jgi:Protein kinase domain.
MFLFPRQLYPRLIGAVELPDTDGSLRKTVALKILNSCYAQSASNLLDTEQTVAQKNPSHQGYGVTRHCLESFEFKSSDKTHFCLVYEAMREPLSEFQKRFENQRMPLPVAKACIHLLLLGLQYLHAECRLIHTGK